MAPYLNRLSAQERRAKIGLYYKTLQRQRARRLQYANVMSKLARAKQFGLINKIKSYL